MREIILINITGKDKPGLTSSLTNILAQYEVTILDIGQAVIHDYLSLGILVEIPTAHSSSSILKDLLFRAHKLGIQIRFSAIDAEGYEGWTSQYGQQRRIITLRPQADGCSAGKSSHRTGGQQFKYRRDYPAFRTGIFG